MEKKAKDRQIHPKPNIVQYIEKHQVRFNINDLYHMIDSMSYLPYEIQFKCVCFSKRFTRDVISLIIK